jgi:error-prone DNA polymerase
MTTPFAHLHVASGYSLRHGASTPMALVERAAELGQPAIALTDRDGLYGAIRFVQACQRTGVAPMLGVDLAVRSVVQAPVRSPVRGGAVVDPRHPRVTVLALGSGSGSGSDSDAGLVAAPARGWARLCRLVSATHLGGERGTPIADLDLIAEHALDPVTGGPALVVLMGPASAVGQALLAGRSEQARDQLQRWRDVLPAGSLVLEVVCHGGPPGSPASVGHAARLLALARQTGLPAVLTNAVRHADPGGAATVDVLDAARRLVALDTRHLDRVTAAGHLRSGAEMALVAEEVADAAGGSRGTSREEARLLLAETMRLTDRCLQDPYADLGIGSVHLPEPGVLGLTRDDDADAVLRARCEGAVGTRYPGRGERELRVVRARLDNELDVVAKLGYPTYFLTVASVCDLIRDLDVRVAARGSGAGSLVNYLLGISGVDPLAYGLLMERFCSPLRAQLPDIDVDVESARRTEVYEHILARFGGERVTCVSMMDTYRVRHAIRDVGAALGMPPGEIDAIAKAFPHIRARDARTAIAELPELRASGLSAPRLDLLFELVERLDGLPRHVALHPCGVVLSDGSLLDRTPVEASWIGFPMSQFDKDDVETMGLLKLDVLGIRMQSAMAHAVQEVARVDGVQVDLDDRDCLALDDEATFRLIRSTHTLGCFQIESPGQRELVGKFGPETFGDLIIDISLFRPGPVKSDMVTPFLMARQRWHEPEYLHPSLEPALRETHGVVVFHEQVLQIVAVTTGVTLAEADEVRRALGSPAGQREVEAWWRPLARSRGYSIDDVERIWLVLKAFASFGFCKAHAAAFALPTYQSAWLKAHHPAAFLAGVLTHDPGMYPKRLILDDARSLGIAVLSLDVNVSDDTYRVERVASWDEPPPAILDQVDAGPLLPDAGPRPAPPPDLPDGRTYGIRLSLSDVKGIGAAEVQRIVAGRPYRSLADFWHRGQVSRPVVERLVVAGGFDSLYGLGGLAARLPLRRRGTVTRRDLLLQVVELDSWSRATARSASRVGARSARGRPSAHKVKHVTPDLSAPERSIPNPGAGADDDARWDGSGRATGPRSGRGEWADWADARDVRLMAAAQSQAPRAAITAAEQSVQLTLDLGDAPNETRPTGLPEMTGAERVKAELEVLGLDASAHVLEFYEPLLDALGITRSKDILAQRSRAELLVAGVKVATQTPPIRSGRRVVFLTLDDATGPVDATFFEDVQGPYAATVFHSWLLLVRGILRRTGPRGVSLRATGAWELSALWEAWCDGGLPAVCAVLDRAEERAAAMRGERAFAAYSDSDIAGAAASRSSRPVMAGAPRGPFESPPDEDGPAAGGMGGGTRHRRVLVHASGFKQSPYSDVRPPGEDVKDARKLGRKVPGDPDHPDALRNPKAPRKLWHASPGSSGH